MRPLLVAVVPVLLLAACMPGSGAPGGSAAVVWADVPTSAPSPQLQGNVCLNGAAAEGGDFRTPVTVDADPTGVVAVRLPTLNTTPCAAHILHGDAATAVALAHDVRAGETIAAGATYSCPAGDDPVTLYFTYAGHTQAQQVDYDVNGCAGWVSAPGRSARFVPLTWASDLAALH